MPKRIVTVYVCSRCKDEFMIPSDVVSFAIKRPPSTAELLLDLCVDCIDKPESMQSLLDMTYSEGPKPKTPKQAVVVAVDGEYPCPEPGCGKSYSTKSGVSQHLSRGHGVVTEHAAKKAAVGTVGDLVCPECEADGVTFRCTKGQGLAAHRRSAHGVIPQPQPKGKRPVGRTKKAPS